MLTASQALVDSTTCVNDVGAGGNRFLLRGVGVALVLLFRFSAVVLLTGGEEASNCSLFSPKMQGVEGAEDFEGDTGDQKQGVCHKDQYCEYGAAEDWRPCSLVSEDDGR